MEARVEFDGEDGIATIRLEGKLTSDQILAAFDRAVDDPRYVAGMKRLWDFSSADLSGLPARTIEMMANFSRKFPPAVRQVKVAFVVSRDLEFGLVRMFQAYTPSDAALVRVFRDHNNAMAWLTANG